MAELPSCSTIIGHHQNSGDNVFEGIPLGKKEAAHFTAYLAGHDFSKNSRRAFTQDMRKFAAWFSSANRERFVVGRVTTRDVADFRDYLRREQGQAVATVNRPHLEAKDFQSQVRLLQQGLPLPSVLGTNQRFQQVVQVALDAFAQHKAVVARRLAGVMAGPEDEVVGLGDDDQFLISHHLRPY